MNLESKSFLITGGAGFIGSNIVDFLLDNGAKFVRVLDNLSNGNISNLERHFGDSRFEFVNGDVRDLATCISCMNDILYVSHQAALGSVPRSINDPITTNEVNVQGFLNILLAAKDSKSVKKLVYAASSSTYGDSSLLPKKEGFEGKPLSPYAVTKLVNELYGDVFSKNYSFHSVGLRYFNVFGPNQSPNNPYAAVIPLFMKAAATNTPPVINGDGSFTRDFTFVSNVVQANILALLNTSHFTKHEVFNVAFGQRTTLLALWKLISMIAGSQLSPVFGSERVGDVAHSHASIDKAINLLGYSPECSLEQGLKITYNWFISESKFS